MRDYHTEEYKAWKKSVLKRDGHQCQMPNCKRKKYRCQVHHIKRWADSEELRFHIDNGITLCIACHRSIFSREGNYEELFTNIVINTKILQGGKLPRYSFQELDVDEE